MKRIRQWKALAVWLLVVCHTQVWAQGVNVPEGEYTLGGIQVEGAQFNDPQTIVQLSGLAVGGRILIPGPDIGKAIEKLWKQDIFSDIQISVTNRVGQELYLRITVVERPKITQLNFKGVRKGQADQLREKVNLLRGTIFTEPKRRQADRIIRNFFQEKGYLNVQVEPQARLDTLEGRNGIELTLKVDKGRKVRIRRLTFQGLTEISEKKAASKLKKTKERRPGFFWRKSKFVRGEFTEDREKLLEFMTSQGYRDAEIFSDSVVVINDHLIDLYLTIYEGPKYYYGNINWVGNTKYTDDQLARILRIKRGDRYDAALLSKRLTIDPGGLDVSSLYLDDGYLFFRAEPVEVNVRRDTIDLEIRVSEGPQATIRRIILEGNDQTSDRVILREVRTLPGEKFSRADLIRSQREIVALGFFDQETMDVQPIPDPSGTQVDIKYKVAERSNDQITLQGGFSGRQRDINGNVIGGGLLATVGLQFNNFSTRRLFKGGWKGQPIPKGDGQKLNLQVQTNGVNFQNYAISFVEPWVGGKKPNSLAVSVNYSIQQQRTINYRLNIFGASVDYGRRLKFPDDFFRLSLGLGYRNYNVSNAGNIFPDIPNGNINILTGRITLDRTSIDAPIFTRSGSSISLNIEATPPWNNILNRVPPREGETLAPSEDRFELLEFYKFKFDTQLFLQVTRNKLPLVFHARARFGFLGAYDPVNIGVSPFERFFLGGDGIQGFTLDGREIIALRGYRTPNIIEPDGQVQSTAGAVVYNKYTFELRQPVTLEQQANVWIHVFAEAGNSFVGIEDYNPFEVRRSVGVGLRAFLPIFGLLGVDYGYGFDPVFLTNGEDISGPRFHFVIGQQF